MGSLADCLKSTTVDKDTSAQIRKLARKYAKTMPPAEADRRAAAELLDAAMSDMETLRSQLVGLGYDVAVQGGYAAQRTSRTLDALSSEINKMGVEAYVSESANAITVAKIIVPKEARGRGVGSKVMEMITQYADSVGKRTVLTPSRDFGASSVDRLKKFYKRFGFVENKGRNKDFSISEAMYREPISTSMQQSAETAGATSPAEVAEAQRMWAEMGTESPYFKRWFGDSKVVDKQGKPLVVYHGTTAGEFEAFRPNYRKGEQFGFGIHLTPDRSFAERYATGEVARKGKQPHVVEGYLSAQNVLDVDQLVREGEPLFDLAKRIAGKKFISMKDENGVPAASLRAAIDSADGKKAERLLREAGYDGIKYNADIKEMLGGGYYSKAAEAPSYVVFDPTQIKSVSNRGTFDATDPRILMQSAETAGATTAAEVAEAQRMWAEMGTESPYFKKWSGGAPVIKAGDEYSGGPAVVVGWHGSPSPKMGKKNAAFDVGRSGERTDYGNFGSGVYVSPSEFIGKAYAGRSGVNLPLYANLANPLSIEVVGPEYILEVERIAGVLGVTEKPRWENGGQRNKAWSDQFREKAMAAGYDGVVTVDAEGALGAEVVAFSPTQIKSVNNRGTFDANDPRILMQQSARDATQTPEFKKWFGKSKVVDKQKKPLVVYHGTGVDIEAFDPDRTGKGNDQLGSGFYFTSDEDTAKGYAGEKGNLTPSYLSIQKPITLDAEQDSLSGVRLTAKQAEAIMLLAPDIFDAEESPLVDWVDNGGKKFTKAHVARVATNYVDQLESLGNDFFRDNATAFREAVNKVTGYDGVSKVFPSGERHFVAWFPEQIKSVNNRGTFDANDPRILYQSAFHGSPYRFDKFTLDAIGTGEGAQAFGWGLYFAGQKSVAEFYRDNLGAGAFSYDGVSLEYDSPKYNAAALLWSWQGDKQGALDDAAGYDNARAIKNEIKKLDFDKIQQGGQLYEVDIPEDDVMLHWDKPLSEQPEKVRAALEGVALPDGLALAPYFSPDPEALQHGLNQSALDGAGMYRSVLAKRLGSDKAASEYLNSLGVKGIKYLDGTSRADGDGSYNYVIFDDAAVEILNTFYQNRWTVPSGAQGMISFGTRSGKPLIQLFESANESTFLHETGHLYLEMIRAMATQPNAPAPIVQIWNDAKAALGMETDDLSVKDHENWARNLEAYFAEGKTPSLGLRKLFTRYAEWLKNIYREVERIFTISGTQMNEDLRPIFDRLFATEQEIKETEAFYEAQKPFFTVADQMAEEDRKKYDKLRNKAVESTHDKRLRQLTEASVKAQGGREAFTAEAREQVDRMPVYNAIESARAEGGIDVETLDELVGEKMRKELGKRWNKIGGAPIVVPAGGVDPELLASQHGYESALAMVQDMLAAPAKGQMVKDIVDSQVAQEREKIARGLLDGGTLPADEAYHNEDRMALLLAEFTLLADTMSKSAGARARAIDSAAVREVARQTLKSYTVSDAMDYMKFARAERKAAIESRLAKEKGDATKALEAKRREMLNHALFMESMQTRKDIAKIEAFMKRTAKQKNIGEDARELARGLGIQYGVIPFQGLTGERAWQAYGAWFAEQEKERQTLEAWTAKYADLYAPYFDPFILSNAGAMSYRELTVEQFVSLRNAVDTIKAVDKQERTIQLAGEAQERDAFIKELAATLTDLKPKPQTRSYRKNKARKAIASYLANHTKAETLLQYLDNWNPDGPWSRLYRALADAEAEQTTRLKPASEELRRIFGPIKKNLGKTVTLPALNDSFTRGELFVAFLNMGNEGNLLRLKEGYGWTDAQLEAIKNELTKEEMDAAQAVWDFIDTFREESFAVEKRMNGRTPERVVPVPVATRNGIYRGGYFPISYDADLSETAFMREQKDLDQTLFGGRNYGAAQTKQGHLKERAAGGGGQAIALDLSVITNHVYNVIHDITHREAVVNVAKIIKDPEVKSIMETYLGIEGYREMWPWLQSVARDVQEPMNQLHRWARWARKGTTIMQMGLKITTMIQQPLGILQTVDVVGKEYTMRGLAYMYGQPSKFPEKAQLVMEKSKFMENRTQAFDRDVRDAMKGMTLKDSVMQEVERFAYKGIGMAQMGVDLPTWWGAYEKARQVEYKDVQDVDAREKKAIAYADSAVRTSQGSGSTLDLSRIQRGGEFQRLLTMFYSYFNTLYNLTYRRAKQTTSYKDVPQLAASAMLLWFLPAVLSDLVSGRGPDDDDEWLPWMAQKIGLYPLQMLVGVRDVANAAFGEFGYQLTPAESAPKSIVNWFKAVEKAIKEGEPERLVKPTVEAIGFIAHLPLKQPIITIGNIWDYATGKDSEFQARDLFFPKQESRRR